MTSVSGGTRRQLFDELAHQSRGVARSLADGRRYGVDQHEETITESLLLDLARSQPNVKVRTFTRMEESRETGADWAWWWEGERRWFGALVQAKVLKDRNGLSGYDFGYRPKVSNYRPDPERQIDLLLKASKHWDLPPLYALYNGPDLNIDPASWHCTEIPYDPEAMGVAVLPAPIASWLLGLGDASQSSTNRFSRPLPCVICPASCLGYTAALRWLLQTPWFEPSVLGFDDDAMEDDLALRAARSVLSSIALARSSQFRRLDLGRAEVANVRRGVREQPPAYVRAAIASSEPLEAREYDLRVPPRVVVVTRPESE